VFYLFIIGYRLEPYFLFCAISDFLINFRRIDDDFSSLGLIMSKLTTKNDVLAVSLETVLQVEQFPFGSGQFIAVGQLGNICALLWGGFRGITRGESQFLLDRILDAISLVDAPYVLRNYAVIQQLTGESTVNRLHFLVIRDEPEQHLPPAGIEADLLILMLYLPI
jgi:hypothetical protein